MAVRDLTPASSSSSPLPTTAVNFRVNLADLCSMQQLVKPNVNNFKRTGPPARLMSYRNGMWIDFSKEIVGVVKSCFVDRKPIVDIVIGASKYLFDFLRMVEISFETGKQRSIAWIDEKGDCYFPNNFVDEDSEESSDESESCNSAEVEIGVEMNVEDDSGKRKRVSAISDVDDEVDSVDVEPKRQRSTPNSSSGVVNSGKWIGSRLLREEEKAYTLIRDYFLSGIRKSDPGATITAIHQCTRAGRLEKARFLVFQNQMETTKSARGSSNTVYAWHGTSARGVESILAHGFGVPSKISTYGVGTYLSPIGLPGLRCLLFLCIFIYLAVNLLAVVDRSL